MKNLWGVFNKNIFVCAFMYKENAEQYIEEGYSCEFDNYEVKEIILEDVKGV